eukprot:318667_1
MTGNTVCKTDKGVDAFLTSITSYHSIYDVEISELKTNQSLQHKICCLCCTYVCMDLIEQLSYEQRVIILTNGYIRKHCNDISADLVKICLNFVGSANGFELNQLQSMKQQRREMYEKYKNSLKNLWDTIKECCPLFIFLFLLGLYFGKDIAAIIIYSNGDCNDVINGKSKYVSFDVNKWLLVGSATHLSVFAALICFFLLSVDSDDKGGIIMLIGCGGCLSIFLIAWVVIGFLLWTETMKNTGNVLENKCSNLILSWSILQTIETFVTMVIIKMLKSVSR